MASVLCVDDEPNVLAGLSRVLGGGEHDIFTAASGQAGLEMVPKFGPFAVVVSDMRMPEMDGAQFLAQMRGMSPDTVRILLTGHADLDSAIRAVNEGAVFRFLTKPTQAELVQSTIDAAVEQHRLITAEKVLLQQTLAGSVKVLTDLLALTSPAAFARASRIRRYAAALAPRVGLADFWQLDLAAMLSPIGLVALPPEVIDKLNKGQGLSDEDKSMVRMHATVGHNLLMNIPRLETVATVVGLQRRSFEEWKGDSEYDSNAPIALASQMIGLLGDLDNLVSRGLSVLEAGAKLQDRPYNPILMTALASVIGENRKPSLMELSVAELQPGMVLADDTRSKSGVLLARRGDELSQVTVERMKLFARGPGVRQPIKVHVQVPK